MEIRMPLQLNGFGTVLCLIIVLNISEKCFGLLNTLQNAHINSITRQNFGDIFTARGTECHPETCVGLSSGTATYAPAEVLENHPTAPRDFCTCQCLRHLPAFREDLHICVDDIHECVLAPFVSGATSQQIPFVFLPLKGQIIHPSKEISFAGIQTPVCAVSGAKFLTENGWIDLRNPLDTDVPFRLFRDEGRTFLQWIGEPELRSRMSGRLALVHLMCRELATIEPIRPNVQSIFSPCVAFRVAGSPMKYLSNVSEVVFSSGAHSADSNGNGLSISEYVAIAICSVLLGLIYVASVFLYLHLRKRRQDNQKILDRRDNPSIVNAEEGVIKNNPLLSLGRHFPGSDTHFTDSTSSDNDTGPDVIQNHEDRKKKMQITSALVHPQHFKSSYTSISSYESSIQDNSTIEKLPEENVSIIETLEGREERPDNFKAITGSTRRKLYFNPAYFEPQLLLAPPPAALEFLIKIREVITIAKQKMDSKKFTPSLLGIPEEEPQSLTESNYNQKQQIVTRKSSAISLKRENSRRRNCSGCPGCVPQIVCGKLPDYPSLAACENCTSSTSESKQRSIRKWLEDVPILDNRDIDINENSNNKSVQLPERRKRLRSPTRSLPPVPIPSSPVRTLSPRPASERARSPSISVCSARSSASEKSKIRNGKVSPSSRRIISRPNTPPPPLPAYAKLKQAESTKVDNNCSEHTYDTVPCENSSYANLPPPDMIHEAMAVDGNKNEEGSKIPTITKKKMNAVINEFAVQRGINRSTPTGVKRQLIDYETDSLERSGANKGYSTSTDYADISSSQPSPSLSSALPMDEEMTMRNAIINTRTGNMTISKINMEMLHGDDHDYELIVLRKNDRSPVGKCNLYDLPELLQRSNGYNLVSEVYVNNGYNYGSAPSTPSESNSSTLESTKPKILYDQPENKPGHLLIEVKDCPDNYIRVEDSDNFEPDTLDRKPSKNKFIRSENENDFIDSLERPNQIRLRTTGSFKRSTANSSPVQQVLRSNFNRNFGSLREIYEAKTKEKSFNSSFRSCSSEHNPRTIWQQDFVNTTKTNEGRILTLEERHTKRQRHSITKGCVIPPDVIPPPPHNNSPIYEHPKPPRKVYVDSSLPPLPPKNGKGRSTGRNKETATTNLCRYESSHGTSAKNSETKAQESAKVTEKQFKSENLMKQNHVNLKGNSERCGKDTNKSEEIIIPMSAKINITDMKYNKTEDSGYLSTDSNESARKRHYDIEVSTAAGSESDESLGDGHSESGAESIETHSVFFGRYVNSRLANYNGSIKRVIKAGVAIINEDDTNSSTDSESLNYGTVVPFRRNSCRNSIVVKQ